MELEETPQRGPKIENLDEMEAQQQKAAVAKEQKADAPPQAAPSDKEQEVHNANDQIIKVISNHFLEFRNKVNMMFKPEFGVIDDMIVTWQNRYIPSDPATKGEAAPAAQAQEPKFKEGRMNVVIYLKTVPDEKTGSQGYNSFTIDAKINFASDPHPATRLASDAVKKKAEGVAAAAAAEEAKKKAASEIL